LRESNFKKLPLYLYRYKKEVILLHPDKKNCKILATATAAVGGKFHPNVVAVLFVTVLICCC